MKILPYLLLSMISFTLGCNAKSIEVKSSQKIKVEPCGFDYDVNDFFCKKDKMDLYKKYIDAKTNYNEKYTIIKIDDGKYYRLVALEQKNNVIYPLNIQVDKFNSIFEYSNNKDELCITGNIYAYRDTYIDSKICYIVVDSHFVKKSITENLKLNNKINTILIPNSSDYFLKCLRENSQKKCENINNTENKLYSKQEISKLFPSLNSMISDERIVKINVDGFRFLPEINNSLYSIAEKYIDTDEETVSEFYLIKIKPTIEIKKIGGYYSINNYGVISYKDQNGKLRKQALK